MGSSLGLEAKLLEGLQEADYVGVGRQLAEGLDFDEVVYLLDALEVALHALDGDVVASLQ